MRVFKTDAFVLRRVDIGEADKLLTVFSKDFGKIKVMAKGVRKLSSKRSPSIELFNLVTLVVHKGKTFDILAETQTISTFEEIRKDLHSIALAYYICELIEGLCPEGQQNVRIFALLKETFKELDNGITKRFEKVLLSELGFLPEDESELDTTSYIEHLLERRIKSRKLLSRV
jgi:DNA repair protein RecO (recombination protein O)